MAIPDESRDDARSRLRDIVEVSGPSLVKARDQARYAQVPDQLADVEAAAQALENKLRHLAPHSTDYLCHPGLGGLRVAQDPTGPMTSEACRDEWIEGLARVKDAAAAGRIAAKPNGRPKDVARHNILAMVAKLFEHYSTQRISSHDNSAFYEVSKEVLEHLGISTGGLQEHIKELNRRRKGKRTPAK